MFWDGLRVWIMGLRSYLHLLGPGGLRGRDESPAPVVVVVVVLVLVLVSHQPLHLLPDARLLAPGRGFWGRGDGGPPVPPGQWYWWWWAGL